MTDMIRGRERCVYGAQDQLSDGLFPDAIRVVARKTEDSPNGPLGLFFARFLGKQSTNLAVAATAVVLPRDIAVVLGLATWQSGMLGGRWP